MEYTDVVFNGFPKKDIDDFVKDELKIGQKNVVGSHFFSVEKGDYEYNDEIVLSKYFECNATCYLYVSELYFGTMLKNVMILITSDMIDLNVTVNIESNQISSLELNQLKRYLNKIHKKYKVRKTIVAEDDSLLEYIFMIE